MAGIYLHIPFCKTRCIYCDFYSTTQSERKRAYVNALCKELEMRRSYLKNEPIETIYFGGGTPSQLEEEDFKQIFATIESVYGLEEAIEVTLEANPDDLTQDYVRMLSSLPFNRISMGVQTFNNDTLKLLNRRHNAAQAIEAVRTCREMGFQNISIDLIYGLPNETLEGWTADLEQAIALKVEHLSAYHLTYEEGTPLYRMLKQNRVHEVEEECSVMFFDRLTERLSQAGYEQYEISNFCRPGFYSKHNSSYWKGTPYLGCGASAHSYNQSSREWNTAAIDPYITGIESGHRIFEVEDLDVATRYNDLIVTAMRTIWGLSLRQVREEFGESFLDYCLTMAQPYILEGKLIQTEETLRLTKEGILVSDAIMRDLLYIEE